MNLGRKRLMEARKMASQHRAQMARKGLLALEKAAQLRAQQQEAAYQLKEEARNKRFADRER